MLRDKLFYFLPKTGRLPPIAKIPHCGGLMMALNSSTPYIPRFDTLYKRKSQHKQRASDTEGKITSTCFGGEERKFSQKSTIFWDIIPPAFTLVSWSAYFFNPEDGGDALLRNFG
jgi:hypothetical protein